MSKAYLGSNAVNSQFDIRRSSAWLNLNGHPLVSFHVQVSTVNDKIPTLHPDEQQIINRK